MSQAGFPYKFVNSDLGSWGLGLVAELGRAVEKTLLPEGKPVCFQLSKEDEGGKVPRVMWKKLA